METFIATENIRRFKAMLATEADEQRRQVLLTLLEQEETKLQSIRAVRPEPHPPPTHVTWRSAVQELMRPLHADAPGPELAAAGTSKNAHRDNGCLGQPGAVLPFAADAALPESSVRPAEAVVAEQNAAMRRGGAAQA